MFCSKYYETRFVIKFSLVLNELKVMGKVYERSRKSLSLKEKLKILEAFLL